MQAVAGDVYFPLSVSLFLAVHTGSTLVTPTQTLLPTRIPSTRSMLHFPSFVLRSIILVPFPSPAAIANRVTTNLSLDKPSFAAETWLLGRRRESLEGE